MVKYSQFYQCVLHEFVTMKIPEKFIPTAIHLIKGYSSASLVPSVQ